MMVLSDCIFYLKSDSFISVKLINSKAMSNVLPPNRDGFVACLAEAGIYLNYSGCILHTKAFKYILEGFCM
jgi:hypothetical protein